MFYILISILVYILIIYILYWAISMALKEFGAPPGSITILKLICLLVVVGLLLGVFFEGVPIIRWDRR
jgi:NADH:ubiquinone oxidoreductase subunit 6 (subunit J)